MTGIIYDKLVKNKERNNQTLYIKMAKGLVRDKA